MRALYLKIRNKKQNRATLFVAAFACLLLSGCGGGTLQSWGQNNNAPTTNKTAPLTPQGEVQELSAETTTVSSAQQPVKVAVLLPLTGQHKKIGISMLNAAQMALFDLGFDTFELLPKDTQGTAAGARAAATAAMNEGATLVLGPLFSHSVRAAREVTMQSGVNMIAFSTDWTLAGDNTYLIGFLPFDQVERAVKYATATGKRRIGVLAPTGPYGDGVVTAFQNAARSAGVQSSRIERFNQNGTDLNLVVRRFSDYDARRATNNQNGAPFDAVLMPVGGTLARQVGSFLNQYDMPPTMVKRVGTGLFDDPTLSSDRTLDGAWFAAPAPSVRAKFENSYNRAYYTNPPRIASLGYDATALAITLARIGIERRGAPAFDRASILNPNGFAGVDGIFRFRANGMSERGLSVLEFRNGGIIVVNNAPTTFQDQRF